eukprot:759383-Pelagomonas_calceolata.AAC.1
MGGIEPLKAHRTSKNIFRQIHGATIWLVKHGLKTRGTREHLDLRDTSSLHSKDDFVWDAARTPHPQSASISFMLPREGAPRQTSRVNPPALAEGVADFFVGKLRGWVVSFHIGSVVGGIALHGILEPLPAIVTVARGGVDVLKIGSLLMVVFHQRASGMSHSKSVSQVGFLSFKRILAGGFQTAIICRLQQCRGSMISLLTQKGEE